MHHRTGIRVLAVVLAAGMTTGNNMPAFAGEEKPEEIIEAIAVQQDTKKVEDCETETLQTESTQAESDAVFSEGLSDDNAEDNAASLPAFQNTEEVQKTGWEKKNGSWYYADKGEYAKGWQEINGQRYFFDETDGTMQTGWVKKNGNWYYFGLTGGALQTGWKKINKYWYFFTEDGVMQTNWKTIGENRFYFGQNGAMKTGWQKINGKWYAFFGTGVMKTGWQKIGGHLYYFRPDGAMQAGGWQKIAGNWYFFTSSGAVKTGWEKRGSSWTFFYRESGLQAVGWAKDGGYWYYFDPGTKIMVTNEFIISDGNTYYVDGNGRMLTNTSRTIRGRKYSFNGSGKATNVAKFGSADSYYSWNHALDSDAAYDVTTKRDSSFVNAMLLYATYFDKKITYGSSQNNTDPGKLRRKHLRSGGTTDCSWFVYHVLHKFGLAEKTFTHSYEWGNKPSAYPGAVNIGNDISKASPGDIICTGKGTKPQNSHVAIYLGNGMQVECGYSDRVNGVVISRVPSGIRQIVHFTCLPKK